MHQPPYWVGDEAPILPWVRLHAIKAYYDMAWIAERFPKVHGVFNFSGALLQQLQMLADGKVRDQWYRLSSKPAELLDLDERAFILEHFFSLSWARLVEPHSRYAELLLKRGRGNKKVPAKLAATFDVNELRDLQCLFNLSWFGFAARETLPEIGELLAQGRLFSESQKARILELQLQVCERILPLYKKLAERGQSELTTTPMNHPILPLLCDTNVAIGLEVDRSMPPRFAWPSDAVRQVHRALDVFERAFGRRPRGMWPAEGAVSDESIGLIASAGLQWIATDEHILLRSPGGEGPRNDVVYRPYTIQSTGGPLNILFRDTEISDLIGFQYRDNPPREAAADLISRIEGAGGRALRARPADRLVTIVLDGENPWEYYPNDGRDFLEALYSQLSVHASVKTVLPSLYLAGSPPARRLERIHPGSWIEADFHIWIGHPAKNQAWKLLGQVRELVQAKLHGGEQDAAVVERVMESLDRAEASDWFWWYGPNFTSDQDSIFDLLFRSNLQRACNLLHIDPPAELASAIESTAGDELHGDFTAPGAFITPRIDGECANYFDWLEAGKYRPTGGQSSMFRAQGLFTDVQFGRDLEHLYLRFDRNPERRVDFELRLKVACGDQVLDVAYSSEHPIDLLLKLSNASSEPAVARHGSASLRRSLVLAIPLAMFDDSKGRLVTWSARVLSQGLEVSRLPSSGSLVVPGLEQTRQQNWFI